ncbi:caspase family protein [candidate division KSB1 bacterium]|nr:caspase family protein [candidate division KSB1 bacterium]
MKILISFILITIIIGSVLPIHAQDYSWHSSNFYEPQIIFVNPAGISFRESRQALLSSQMLYTGLANDNLYNHHLGYVEPLQSIGVFGLRGSFFTSHLLKNNTFSLLYSRSLIQSRLSFGINVNLHHDSYDRSKFQLRDPNDPLLAKSTSTTALSVGLGFIYAPSADLNFGFSLDDLNQPDISLEGNSARKPLSARFGLCYRIFNLVPEFDLTYLRNSQRSETYYVLALRQLWLDNAANLSFQYQGNCLAIGTAYTIDRLRLDYHYTYPLSELQEISSGTHQFTLSFNFGHYQGYPTSPEIELQHPKAAEVDSNCFNLQAHVKDKRGLQQIRIELNAENFTTFNYTQKDKIVKVNAPIFPLRDGANRIKLIASNDVKKSVKEIKLNYTAPEVTPSIVSPPKVEILAPLKGEIHASSLQLKVSVEFILELKDIKIKVNNREIQLRGMRALSKERDKTNIEADLELEQGINEIEVIAFNDRGSGSRKTSILYNPIEISLYNKLRAVVIGIDAYHDKNVKDLNYAVHDARAIAKLLRDYFYFDHIIELYNNDATKNRILSALSTELNDAKENDGVFVFFAGHGCTGEGIEGGPLGFIVPVDGTFDEREYFVKNIPMSIIKEISQTIEAKHIYYVMDCCYGGLLLRSPGSPTQPSQKTYYEFLESLAKWRVRQVLTAGGKDQPVLDGGLNQHSIFTGILLRALKGEADFNQDGFITAEEINFFVRQWVYANAKDVVRGHPVYKNIEQMPQYGKWSGEGEFIFSNMNYSQN